MDSVIFNTHDVVLLMTAYQCVIFAALLVSIRRERKLPFILLALFLLQHAAIPIDILIQFGAEFRNIALSWSPNIFYVFGFSYWLEGPLLLWYTRSLVRKNYSLNYRDMWLLLPCLLFLIYEIAFYYSLDFETKVGLQEGYTVYTTPAFASYITVFRDVFRVVLGLLCLVELRRYHKRLRHEYSDVERRELNWLKLLIIGFLIIRGWSVVVVFFVMLAIVFEVYTDFGVLGLVGNYSGFVLITMLIFFSLKNAFSIEGLEASTGGSSGEKFKPEQADLLASYMTDKKPYLEHDLTLEKLAGQLSMTPRTVSNIINRHFKCNFFEFVNAYRIEEAMALLRSPEAASKGMLDILHEVGFRSKTTFNTLFKKKVGLTPSEYRKTSAEKRELT